MQGRRNTVQKNVILSELLKADHPTATQLYERIRETYPKISRATVFRVLADFAALGVIRKLEFLGSDTRYDGSAQPHAHCYCVNCGKVTDVYDNGLDELLSVESVQGFKVLKTELEFNGLCPQCRQK